MAAIIKEFSSINTHTNPQPSYHRKVLICGYNEDEDCLCETIDSLNSICYDENDDQGGAILECEEEEINQIPLQNLLIDPVVENDGNEEGFKEKIVDQIPINNQVEELPKQVNGNSVPVSEFFCPFLPRNLVVGKFCTNPSKFIIEGKVYDEMPRSVLKEGCVYIVTNQYPPKYNDSGGGTRIPVNATVGLTKKLTEQVVDIESVDVANKLLTVEYVKDLHQLICNSSMMKQQMMEIGYNAFVWNVLIDMYVKCGQIDQVWWLFDQIVDKNVVLWNLMYSGYLKHGQPEKCFDLFHGMKLASSKADQITFSTILGDFFQMENIEGVRKTFVGIKEKDKVCWTTMTVGYAQNYMKEDALILFDQMLLENIKPENFTLSGVVSSCARMASLYHAQLVHGKTIHMGVDSDLHVSSFLVNMYFKCGKNTDAWSIFNMMPTKNVISWNSMIMGYGAMKSSVKSPYENGEIYIQTLKSDNDLSFGLHGPVVIRLLIKPFPPYIDVHTFWEDFDHLTEICFKSFVNRMKYWTTINEPNMFVQMAYMRGVYPPAHCSVPFGHCSIGNSDIDLLIAMHNMLLANGKTAKLCRKNFQSKQGEVIGIVIFMFIYKPLTDDKLDQEDCKINGYDIIANSRIMINSYAIMRDPHTWNYLTEFIPERFSENSIGSNQHYQVDMKAQNFNHLPFGSGSRACPGASLALTIMHMVIGGLVQCFDFKGPQGALITQFFIACSSTVIADSVASYYWARGETSPEIPFLPVSSIIFTAFLANDCTKMDKNQEQGELLKPYMESINSPLMFLVRSKTIELGEASNEVLEVIKPLCIIIYSVVTVYVYKDLIRFFPHLVSDLELTVSYSGEMPPQHYYSSISAASKYRGDGDKMCYFYILMLVPFDISSMNTSISSTDWVYLPPYLFKAQKQACDDADPSCYFEYIPP